MRRALVTSIGLVLLRRRLEKQSGPKAAIALLALQLLGPRIVHLRRMIVWAVALTIVGGIAVAAVWWWRRGRSPEPTWEPALAPEPAGGPVPPDADEASPPPDWGPAAA
jgi:hypothetical protein